MQAAAITCLRFDTLPGKPPLYRPVSSPRANSQIFRILAIFREKLHFSKTHLAFFRQKPHLPKKNLGNLRRKLPFSPPSHHTSSTPPSPSFTRPLLPPGGSAQHSHPSQPFTASTGQWKSAAQSALSARRIGPHTQSKPTDSHPSAGDPFVFICVYLRVIPVAPGGG